MLPNTIASLNAFLNMQNFFNVESRVFHEIVASQELFSVVKPGFSLAHRAVFI